MMSLKSVNALSHFTNWTIAHAHAGGLGWNGFFTFGMLYWLLPRLWTTELYSVRLATAHFWVGLLGIGVYVLSMWAAGITEGLMWKEFDGDGRLVYGSWDEMMPSLFPMLYARAVGGGLFVLGVLMLAYNLFKTWQTRGDVADTEVEVPVRQGDDSHGSTTSAPWHHRLEGKPLQFTIYATIAVAVGGLFELIPSMAIKSNVPTISAVRPYSPLELEGRDIYIAEGCYNCHSQMVRPFREETIRYGEYSKPGEFVYDHPFQWGSRRTGPDLHRVGGKYPDMWHYNHMLDPRSTSPSSLMPSYAHLFEQDLDLSQTADKVAIFNDVFGAEYGAYEADNAQAVAMGQAMGIAKGLTEQGMPDVSKKKIVALIAYLQRLGTDIKNAAPDAAAGQD